MRIRISHAISYVYAEPARHITQILRLTPRDHDGQHVMSWRIEPTIDGRLRATQDPFGNIVHTFSADGPIADMAIQVEGLIETTDLAGIVRGVTERVPVEVFRRDTLLTMPDAALTAFAEDVTRAAETPLSKMHALMEALHETLPCIETGQRTGLGAAAAFAAGESIPQDLAHVFMTCARHLDVPARYVSGYVAQSDTLPHANGAHAWAEVHLDDYGWIGFDPANGLCPIDTHVRVAAGLDFADAAPVRGARKGGDGEALAVRVSARNADGRAANQ
ncbi:MAG: transglutaminase family protein [Bosea sp. (in: a-proteobacteria)]|jgi:transglutaminase-like putative cysteine protease|uniref:transglutaminase family protein n=1 Tax=Bosea sp. (in: a-proteobacteria) TaxID=1871050 RepID=UPI000A775D09|nr:transglutaminase family protein [Bosea sp. (in: a-proteobacteria)]MBA4269301.1 transglutaminase [Methylobacterium sp.]MDP3601411.1 transglutaminase family protein [Bosea sp. (in: a-proteobacteria)]